MRSIQFLIVFSFVVLTGACGTNSGQSDDGKHEYKVVSTTSLLDSAGPIVKVSFGGYSDFNGQFSYFVEKGSLEGFTFDGHLSDASCRGVALKRTELSQQANEQLVAALAQVKFATIEPAFCEALNDERVIADGDFIGFKSFENARDLENDNGKHLGIGCGYWEGYDEIIAAFQAAAASTNAVEPAYVTGNSTYEIRSCDE